MTDPLESVPWTTLAREVDELRAKVRDLPVMVPAPAREPRAAAERYDFVGPIPLDQLTSDVSTLLRRYAVHVMHPRYFGLFNPSVRAAAIAADTLAAAYNPQLAAWSHAPAAQELERHTLRTLARTLGYDADQMLACFTSGGAEANLSAVLCAIAERFPETSDVGVGALAARGIRPAIYLTEDSHHSFVKIARMTGLGTNALRHVPLTNRHAMDAIALAHQLASDVRDGWTPFCIVATAGTTGTGTIDPIPALADLTTKYHMWLHVDAAWGGAAALVPRLRAALTGIERADSITWDAHKWLSVPMGAGMFFCRHPEAAKRAFGVQASYMPAAGSGGADEVLDPFSTTAQWSRRAIGLKVFMSLAELGLDGYARLIEHQADMGDRIRERLVRDGWIIVNDTPLPVVNVTHADVRAGRISTQEIVERIQSRGRVWISDVVLGSGERALRICVTSYLTDAHDLEVLAEELALAIA